MMKVVTMVPTEWAALRDVVTDVIQSIASPEGLGQIPVEKASAVRRHTTIKEQGASGRKIHVGHAVVRKLEAAPRALQVKAIPVQAQPVCQQCRGSIRQVQDRARRVEELEGGLEGPPHSTQREVCSAYRTTYCRP